jgi:hypothetical protein
MIDSARATRLPHLPQFAGPGTATRRCRPAARDLREPPAISARGRRGEGREEADAARVRALDTAGCFSEPG